MKSGENEVLTENQVNQRLANVEYAFGNFLNALGYDWENDPNLKDTPKRVAKMYIKEVTSGAYTAAPKITTFPNERKYDGIVFDGPIKVHSLCSHHFEPFVGKAYVAYIPKADGKVLGLSKLNRIVHWFSKRPQLQENLTKQIHDYIEDILQGTQGIIVYIEADHMCVRLRGAEDDSSMATSYCSGYFKTNQIGSRDEFFRMVENIKNRK